MLAIVSPGQGSQTAGLLRPWLDLPGVADALGRWGAVAGLDLVHLGTEADAETVRDTAVAQPLLVATALVSARAAGVAHLGDGVHAGHSVGELAAASLAGVLSPADAVAAAAVRGAAMAEACAATDGTMAAVLGGDPDEVLAAIAAAGLVAANRNGAGQVVAAGPRAAVEALVAAPPAGARVRPLVVAGPFHTPAMAPAVPTLQAHLATVIARPTTGTLLTNSDGSRVPDAATALRLLAAQVTSPVRWDACLETMLHLGVTGLLELAPGGTLAGIARRALPGVEVVALRSPDDLDAARALVAAHCRTAADSHRPAFTLVVAPRAGNLVRSVTAIPGVRVPAGGTIGEITGRGTPLPLLPHADGELVEWLAEEGDPVGVGQPVARIARVEEVLSC